MKIAIDILSDPICPWCYIGKTRLDQAMIERPDHPFEIRWRPFQLNPDMPAEGMDRRAYLERKFGGPEGAARVYGAIEQTAKDAGLQVRFDLIARTPNTIDAHRLIRWADSMDAQTPVVEDLFKRYFERGEDISDHGVLAEVAEIAGLDRAVIERLLATDTDSDAVREEDKTARGLGVSGVPTFIIDGRYVVPGAQDPELWVKTIDEITSAASA
ncbi:MAG: DsbA family oxidoreductase, partial [Pseudomonadota bacterium]